MPLRLILADSEGGRDYVLAVIGPLDAHTSNELRGWLTNPAPGYGVVLDLSASPVSAACVDLVVDASRRLAAEGHVLRVIAPDQAAVSALQAAGIANVVIDRRYENRLAPDAAAELGQPLEAAGSS
jgi:anti-anti-sigma regulatory factor